MSRGRTDLPIALANWRIRSALLTSPAPFAAAALRRRPLRLKPACFKVLLTCGLVTVTPFSLRAAMISRGRTGFGIDRAVCRIISALLTCPDSVPLAAACFLGRGIRFTWRKLYGAPHGHDCNRLRPAMTGAARLLPTFSAGPTVLTTLINNCSVPDGGRKLTLTSLQ